MTLSPTFVERCERAKEKCKQRLRTEIESTIDDMFSFFMDELNFAVQSAVENQIENNQFNVKQSSTKCRSQIHSLTSLKTFQTNELARPNKEWDTSRASTEPSFEHLESTPTLNCINIQSANLQTTSRTILSKQHSEPISTNITDQLPPDNINIENTKVHNPSIENISSKSSLNSIINPLSNISKMKIPPNNREKVTIKIEPNFDVDANEMALAEAADIEDDEDDGCDCSDCEGIDVKDEGDDNNEVPTPKSTKRLKTDPNTNPNGHNSKISSANYQLLNAHSQFSNTIPLGDSVSSYASTSSSIPDETPKQNSQLVNQIIGSTTSSQNMMQPDNAMYMQQQLRSYQCQYSGCGKWFYRLQHQIDHERIHRGARPFRCRWENCQYDAAQRSDVIKHVRMRHFNLPKSLKIQKLLNIVDDRRPTDYVEVLNELL